MKLVVSWLGLVALALVAAGSCSIKHQSEQYECDTNADCVELGDNRVCSDGLCVVSGVTKDAAVDGPRSDAPPPDAALVCPSTCTSCNLDRKECNIDCSANPQACGSAVACPSGFACNIKCNTPSSCRMGVSCTAGQSCNIECTGNFSCRGIQCGAGACSVNCTGNNSCGNITCGSSCACDVKCGMTSACFNVSCTKPACDTGAGCSSEPATCDTCP